MMKVMRILAKLFIAGVLIFGLLQLVRPGIPAKPASDIELEASPEVKQILEKGCYSCHSDQRRLSWFDEIVPAYWLVRNDILSAREHINFSTLGAKPAAAQKATLYEAVNMVQLGAMPLPQFLKLHPEARLTPAERATLKAYLAPWTTALPVANAQQAMGPTAAPIDKAAVQPELNGFAFDSSFENWKPLSTTDRGDNNTFRFILGNAVAVKAAQSGEVTPWPDGARFAKIAWQQELGADGLVHPGKFIQVELMVKNARGYKATEGWGWGRWRGLDLKPYGKDAHFVNECTSCHQPLRGNDYVYTMPISTATVGRDEVMNNAAAGLAAQLPYQPLGWNGITLYVDPRTRTTATLYGNDAAMAAVRTRGTGPAGGPVYPPGAVLALVTWAQRDDPHWFGARIPDRPQMVEIVQVAGGGAQPVYQRFHGPAFTAERDPQDEGAQSPVKRTSFMLGLAPVQLP
jgi:Haem-binding domain/Cytochrome P460